MFEGRLTETSLADQIRSQCGQAKAGKASSSGWGVDGMVVIGRLGEGASRSMLPEVFVPGVATRM